MDLVDLVERRLGAVIMLSEVSRDRRRRGMRGTCHRWWLSPANDGTRTGLLSNKGKLMLESPRTDAQKVITESSITSLLLQSMMMEEKLSSNKLVMFACFVSWLLDLVIAEAL